MKPAKLLQHIIPLLVACTSFLCKTTDPESAVLVKAIADRALFVTEPIDFYCELLNQNPGDVTFGVSGLPQGASINSSTGLFSWRPAAGDVGTWDAVFTASDGSSSGSATAAFTVEMPSLEAGEGLRVLRPKDGDVYTYGDTMMVAFCMIECGDEADIRVKPKTASPYGTGCSATPTSALWMRLGGDSVDARGVECRYFGNIEGTDLNMGFYKLVVQDSLYNGPSCSVEVGGEETASDSIRIHISDPYAMESWCFAPDCANCISGTAMELARGEYSGYFSIVPKN